MADETSGVVAFWDPVGAVLDQGDPAPDEVLGVGADPGVVTPLGVLKEGRLDEVIEALASIETGAVV